MANRNKTNSFASSISKGTQTSAFNNMTEVKLLTDPGREDDVDQPDFSFANGGDAKMTATLEHGRIRVYSVNHVLACHLQFHAYKCTPKENKCMSTAALFTIAPVVVQTGNVPHRLRHLNWVSSWWGYW